LLLRKPRHADVQRGGEQLEPRVVAADQLAVEVQRHAGRDDANASAAQRLCEERLRVPAGDEQHQEKADHPLLDRARDDDVEQPVVEYRGGHRLHAAAEVAAVADREDRKAPVLRLRAVEADLRAGRPKEADGVAHAAQVDAEPRVVALVLLRLHEHLGVEPGSGDVQKVDVVHPADVDRRERRVQLPAQRLEGVLRQVQRFDEVVSGAAAEKQKGKAASRHAVDDFKQRPVAPDGDDAVHPVADGLGGVRPDASVLLGQQQAIGDAFLPEQRLHAGIFPHPAPVSGDGIDNQSVHRTTSLPQ